MLAVGRGNSQPRRLEEFSTAAGFVGHERDEEGRFRPQLRPVGRVVGERINTDARPTQVLFEIVGVAPVNGPGGPDIQEETLFPVLKEITNDDFLGENRILPAFGENSGPTWQRLNPLGLTGDRP